MDFFDKIGKKVTETYNVASEKTGKLAKEAKLKIEISDNERLIKDTYVKIGERIYTEYLNKRDNDVALQFISEFKEVDGLKEDIKLANQTILELNDKIKCKKCNTEFESKFDYCPSCGEKIGE